MKYVDSRLPSIGGVPAKYLIALVGCTGYGKTTHLAKILAEGIIEGDKIEMVCVETPMGIMYKHIIRCLKQLGHSSINLDLLSDMYNNVHQIHQGSPEVVKDEIEKIVSGSAEHVVIDDSTMLGHMLFPDDENSFHMLNYTQKYLSELTRKHNTLITLSMQGHRRAYEDNTPDLTKCCEGVDTLCPDIMAILPREGDIYIAKNRGIK